MTNEEHIENLKAIASDMPSDKCSDWIESLMAGVKALEQEPFMNIPCVSHQVCHEDKVKILDKIRTEIEELPKTYPFVNHQDMYVKEDDVKKIINKYIAERSEE